MTDVILSCAGDAGGSEQSIPIVLTQQELAALVQQQQQLQSIHQPEPEPEPEPEPQHSSIPTGTPAVRSLNLVSLLYI